MYLCHDIDNIPMCGVFPFSASMRDARLHLGYRQMYLTIDGRNQCIRGHEFHYSDSTNNGTGFLAAKASGRGSWECATATPTLYAGYPHIHLWGNPEFARNFVQHCCEFAAQL